MNDLVARNGGLINTEGDLTIIFQEPLRLLTPISRTVKRCREDLVELGSGVDDRSSEWTKQQWEQLRPRVNEVLAAGKVLAGIAFGDKAVDPETIIKIVATLQNTIGTAKKSDEANAMAQICAINMFDSDIDAAGTGLQIWNEVPRDPTIVALASQSLLVNSTFTPSHAELASACRTACRKIEQALKVVLEWLEVFDECDARLLRQSRQFYEDWAQAYLTVESNNLVEDLHNFVSHFEFKRPNWPHQVQRRDVEQKHFWSWPPYLRAKFFVVMKTKIGLPLSDADLKGISSSFRSEEDFARWFDFEEYMRQERLREEEERRREEEERRREKERQRLIEKRTHECSFCGKAEKKVDYLINAAHIRPFLRWSVPMTICSECIDEGINDTVNSTLCCFCGATDKRVVLSGVDNQTTISTICEECFELCEKELQLASHPIIDFTIGERGKLSEKFAKDKARKFNAFVESQGATKAAIYLKMEGYEDDYGQPLYSDEAPEVAAYVRKWARFAKLDLKRAVQLFGPETWGGNNLPETLHFLLMCDAVGEFSSRFDGLMMDECIEAAVKLCATRKGN